MNPRGGAGELLVAVLRDNENDKAPLIFEYACAALGSLATGNRATKEALLNAGAVTPLTAAWRINHSGNTRCSAHKALNALGFNDDGTHSHPLG